MNIKNYTSGVPAEKSIGRIEKILVEMSSDNLSNLKPHPAYVFFKLRHVDDERFQ
jgi:hypothetical protein